MKKRGPPKLWGSPLQRVDKTSTRFKRMAKAILLSFLKKELKSSSFLETLGSKPFLTRMSSEMILLEVAPQAPKKSENKLKNEFVYSLKRDPQSLGGPRFFDA